MSPKRTSALLDLTLGVTRMRTLRKVYEYPYWLAEGNFNLLFVFSSIVDVGDSRDVFKRDLTVLIVVVEDLSVKLFLHFCIKRVFFDSGLIARFCK